MTWPRAQVKTGASLLTERQLLKDLKIRAFHGLRIAGKKPDMHALRCRPYPFDYFWIDRHLSTINEGEDH
jgi:hypothetical protein